ncbi:unnamed protein product [Linum trigynum]|uniref:Uncharacterized protein n=1 Tax=Linum trigynum TaxID=586398 RepID=A0AAV2DSI3_9ROSI
MEENDDEEEEEAASARTYFSRDVSSASYPDIAPFISVHSIQGCHYQRVVQLEAGDSFVGRIYRDHPSQSLCATV